MTTQSKHTFGTGRRLSVFAQDELQRLDAAAMEVLEQVGVAIASERAQHILARAGADVEAPIVRFPRDLVRRLVGQAPPVLTLGARAAAPLVTGRRPLLTTDGCCVEIYDLESGAKRATTGADVAAISQVVDGMPEVDFCWPSVSAQDSPVEWRGLHELYLAVSHTGKHVQTVTVVEPQQAETAVAMARVVAGGEETLRREPPISALLGTVTPLGTDAGTLEAGLVFAAAGVPVGFVTMPMGGSTTPITMAGSLVVAIAEALSSVCVIQAAAPGAPVFICFIPSIMDLKSGDFTGGAPEDTLMGAAVGDIGAFYGLPTQAGVNSSGAKRPGWQSALDDTTTTFLSIACGVDMLAGVGMISGGRIFNYEELALGVEVVARARRVAAGVDLSGLDGRRASGSEAPAATPAVTAASTSSDDVDDVRERARRRVRALLREHRPPALAPAVDDELRRLAHVGRRDS